jgi:hypothetical protein
MKTSNPDLLAIDPDAPATEDELRAAADLRVALDDVTRDNDDARLARALVLAHSPRPLDASDNETLVQGVLAARPLSLVSRPRRSRAAWLGAGVAIFAVAAGVLLFQPERTDVVAVADDPALLRARSAQPLFHEPFLARGGASSRIDRIAAARGGDLRENMFARWDVR